MGAISDRVSSPEFAALSSEDKVAESKLLFSDLVESSPELQAELSEAGEDGVKSALTNFRTALSTEYPDSYSKKVTRKITETRNVPSTGIIGGLPRTKTITEDREFTLPLLAESQERAIRQFESGEITPESLIPDYEPTGNPFPTNHPSVKNEDGSYSNVITTTVSADGVHYVIPTMVEGKQLSFDEAWDIAKGQGLDKYPSFDNAEAAEKFTNALSKKGNEHISKASIELHDKQKPPSKKSIRFLKALKDLTDEEVAKISDVIGFTNALSKKGNEHISKARADAFRKFGNDLIIAKGGKSLTDEQLLAGGSAYLGLQGINQLILDPLGEKWTRATSGLEGEELEAHMAKVKEMHKEYTDLELNVRREEIQSAKTFGAIAGLVSGGMGLAKGLTSATSSTMANLGKMYAGEAVLGGIHGVNVPSFAVEVMGVDPKSKTAVALNVAEAMTFAAVGNLLSGSGRALHGQAAREAFQGFMSKLETPKLMKEQLLLTGDVATDSAKGQLGLTGDVAGEQKLLTGDTVESIQAAAKADAKVMAKEYGIPEEEAFEIIDETFAQPAMSRRDVIDPNLTKEVQSPEALDRLNARLRAEEVGEPVSKVEVDPSIIKQAEDLQSPIDLAINKARVSATNEAVTTAERRALRAEQLEEAAQTPKTAVEVAAEKKAIKQGIKKGSAELENQQLEEAFNSININKGTAAKINLIENTDTLTRSEKNALISGARKDAKGLPAKVEDVMARKAADPSISDAAKAKAAEFQAKLNRPIKRAVSGHDVAQAKASVALAQDVDDLAKMNKGQINNFLIKPLSKQQLKNTPKNKLLDQFEIEKTRAIQEEAGRVDIKPKPPKGEGALAKLQENDNINSTKTDSEYNPSADSKARFDADIDSPQNPNRVPTEGKPLTEAEVAARKETQAANEEALGVDPMPDDPKIPQAVQEAHQRLLDFNTKQFHGGKSGLSIFDAQTYKDYATVGAYWIGRGFNKFAPWAKEMVNRYGRSIKGNLGDLWDASKNMFHDPKRHVLKGMKAIDETFGITAPRNEPLSHAVARTMPVRAVDHMSSPIMTRIARISKSIKGKMNLVEFEGIKNAGDAIARSENFLKGMKLLGTHADGDPKLFQEFDRALMNADSHAAKDMILEAELDGKLKDMLVQGIDDVRVELDKFHTAAREAGLEVGYLKDYFPRVVKDHDGLMKYISRNKDLHGKVKDVWREESEKIGRDLSTAEKSELANNFLLNQAADGRNSKFRSGLNARVQEHLDKEAARIGKPLTAEQKMQGSINFLSNEASLGRAGKLDDGAKSNIETLWKEEAKRIERPLSTAEKSELANRYLLDQASGGKKSKLGMEEKRKINHVSRELYPFYGDTHENIMQYFAQGYDRIAKQKLFGKHVKTPVGKKRTASSFVNYDEDSIGSWITQNAKGINPKDMDLLTDLVKLRFVQGEATAWDWMQDLRNIGYIATMGKFDNAVTQVGDLVLAMQEHPRDFLKGVKNTILFSDDAVKTVELGITKIQEDIASNPRMTGKALDKVFSTTGLKHIDKFGKNVFLSSAYAKFQRFAKSGGKGLEKFAKEHTELFGEEFTEKLIKDLKAGKRSYEVDAALFNDLTGVQPITKSEMPAFYLKYPNLRIFYMLKSYSLKQLDRIRRDGVDELIDATGMVAQDPKGAAKKSAQALYKMSSIVLAGAIWEGSTADVIKDAMRGNPIDIDSIKDASITNMWRLMGVNKHLRNLGESRSGYLQDQLSDWTPPIVGLFDDAISDAVSLGKGDLSMETSNLVYAIPYGGSTAHWRGPQGDKRRKRIAEERMLAKHPLFKDREDADVEVKTQKQKFARTIEQDLHLMKDLDTKEENVRYIKQVLATDRARGEVLKDRYKRKLVREKRGLTPEEVKFTNKSPEFKVIQLHRHLNTFRNADARAKEYNRLAKKGIITRSVARKLRPMMKGE